MTGFWVTHNYLKEQAFTELTVNARIIKANYVYLTVNPDVLAIQNVPGSRLQAGANPAINLTPNQNAQGLINNGHLVGLYVGGKAYHCP